MDGFILSLVGTGVVIISAVGATAWHLANKISDQGKGLSKEIAKQCGEISGLKSEVKGMKETYGAVQKGCQQLFEVHSSRITRLEGIEDNKRHK